MMLCVRLSILSNANKIYFLWRASRLLLLLLPPHTVTLSECACKRYCTEIYIFLTRTSHIHIAETVLNSNRICCATKLLYVCTFSTLTSAKRKGCNRIGIFSFSSDIHYYILSRIIRFNFVIYNLLLTFTMQSYE